MEKSPVAAAGGAGDGPHGLRHSARLTAPASAAWVDSGNQGAGREGQLINGVYEIYWPGTTLALGVKDYTTDRPLYLLNATHDYLQRWVIEYGGSMDVDGNAANGAESHWYTVRNMGSGMLLGQSSNYFVKTTDGDTTNPYKQWRIEYDTTTKTYSFQCWGQYYAGGTGTPWPGYFTPVRKLQDTVTDMSHTAVAEAANNVLIGIKDVPVGFELRRVGIQYYDTYELARGTYRVMDPDHTYYWDADPYAASDPGPNSSGASGIACNSVKQVDGTQLFQVDWTSHGYVTVFDCYTGRYIGDRNGHSTMLDGAISELYDNPNNWFDDRLRFYWNVVPVYSGTARSANHFYLCNVLTGNCLYMTSTGVKNSKTQRTGWCFVKQTVSDITANGGADQGYNGNTGVYMDSFDHSDTIKLPIKIYDYVNDGMLFEYAQYTGTQSTTNSPYLKDDGVSNMNAQDPDTYQNRNYNYVLVSNGEFQYSYDDELFFNFEGDDDVYLFINGQLVLDIGGAHAITGFEINLNDYVDDARAAVASGNYTARDQALALVEGGIYDFDFYYMERHGWGSNMRLVTNIRVVEKGMLVSKDGAQFDTDLDSNDMIDPDAAVEYKFSLTNSGTEDLIWPTFVDSNIGVTISYSNGLVVTGSNGVTVMDKNGGALDVTDLIVTYTNPKTGNTTRRTFATNGELTAYLTNELIIETQDKSTPPFGVLTIGGIYYKLTEQQVSDGVFHNTVQVTAYTRNGNTSTVHTNVPTSAAPVTIPQTITGDSTQGPVDGSITVPNEGNTNLVRPTISIPGWGVTINPEAGLQLNTGAIATDEAGDTLDVSDLTFTYTSPSGSQITKTFTDNQELMDYLQNELVVEPGGSLTVEGIYADPVEPLDKTFTDEIFNGFTDSDRGVSVTPEGGLQVEAGSDAVDGNGGTLDVTDLVFVYTAPDGTVTELNFQTNEELKAYLQGQPTIESGDTLTVSGIYFSRSSNVTDFENTVTIGYYPRSTNQILGEAESQDYTITTKALFQRDEASYNKPQSPDQTVQYGYDKVYAGSSDVTMSGGTIATVTVGKDLTQAARFTFKGTGFEMVSRTDALTSAIVEVAITDEAGITNYYPVTTEFDQITTTGPAGNGGTETVYQVPVFRITDLPYGSYEVTISGIPTLTGPDAEVDFRETTLYIDGIRIYNPLGTDSVPEYGEEDGAIFTELRSMVFDSTAAVVGLTLGENGAPVLAGTFGRHYSFTENLRGWFEDNTGDLKQFAIAGPNNEIYVDGTSNVYALVLYVKETAGQGLLHVSVHDLYDDQFYGVSQGGNVPATLSYWQGTGWTDPIPVGRSGTEQYYAVDYRSCPRVDGYYQVVIQVASGMASFTNAKTVGLTFGTLAKTTENVHYQYEDGVLLQANRLDDEGNVIAEDKLEWIPVSHQVTASLFSLRPALMTAVPAAPEPPAEPEQTEPTEPEQTEPTEPEQTEPTEPEQTEPAESTEPTEKAPEPVKKGWWQRLWEAIVNFFKSLFGFGKEEQA